MARTKNCDFLPQFRLAFRFSYAVGVRFLSTTLELNSHRRSERVRIRLYAVLFPIFLVAIVSLMEVEILPKPDEPRNEQRSVTNIKSEKKKWKRRDGSKKEKNYENHVYHAIRIHDKRLRRRRNPNKKSYFHIFILPYIIK